MKRAHNSELILASEFADPPPHPAPPPQAKIGNEQTIREDEPVMPERDPPTTLMQWAVLILNTPNPALKVRDPCVLLSIHTQYRTLGSKNTTCCAALQDRSTQINRSQILERATASRCPSAGRSIFEKHR